MFNFCIVRIYSNNYSYTLYMSSNHISYRNYGSDINLGLNLFIINNGNCDLSLMKSFLSSIM